MIKYKGGENPQTLGSPWNEFDVIYGVVVPIYAVLRHYISIFCMLELLLLILILYVRKERYLILRIGPFF